MAERCRARRLVALVRPWSPGLGERRLASPHLPTLKSRSVPVNKKAPSKKPAPSTKPLWQKLFIKGGAVLLVNTPAGYSKVLDGSPAKVTTRASGTAETVLLFATDEAQFKASVPAAMKSMGPSTSVWIAYRKGDKEFHRDTIGALAKSFGLEAVSLVAIDDTWSALRVKRA